MRDGLPFIKSYLEALNKLMNKMRSGVRTYLMCWMLVD
jgi:hypothetical protein